MLREYNLVAINYKWVISGDWHVGYKYKTVKTDRRTRTQTKLLGQVKEIKFSAAVTIGQERDVSIMRIKTTTQEAKTPFGIRPTHIDWSKLNIEDRTILEQQVNTELTAKQIAGLFCRTRLLCVFSNMNLYVQPSSKAGTKHG